MVTYLLEMRRGGPLGDVLMTHEFDTHAEALFYAEELSGEDTWPVILPQQRAVPEARRYERHRAKAPGLVTVAWKALAKVFPKLHPEEP